MYGQNVHYGSQEAQFGEVRAEKPKSTRHKRLNIIAVCLALFVPWLIFCGAFALQSFSFRYNSPRVVYLILMFSVIVLSALALPAVYNAYMRHGDGGAAGMTWMPFLWVTALISLLFAVYFGDRNFWFNTQRYYDITSMNTYPSVDPSTTRGQEIMDAGQVTFIPGAKLDLKRSIGFKNMDTYCVAPITGGVGLVDSNAPLAVYDFWAVGRNCCSADAGAADFKCGSASPSARSGLRIVGDDVRIGDDERAYYRLAVQQAQSAYQVKAVHPLFFTWVEDGPAEVAAVQHSSLKYFLAGMYMHFFTQLALVVIGMVFVLPFKA